MNLFNSCFLHILGACILVAVFPGSGTAQLLFEDFNAGIPGTWTIIDNDGHTPQPGYAFFTNGWIAFEDTPGDTVAASTSWYASPDTSDDWLISPAIAIPASPVQTLRWQAYTFDPAPFADGYEVRVSTTGTAVADFTDILFSIAEENTSWTTRQTSLSAYSGQTIYIAWRNNSINKNLLFVNNVEITDPTAFYDVNLIDAEFLSEFDQQPFVQVVAPFNFGATVANTGFDPVTNVDVNVEVFDASGNSVFTDGMGSSVANLAIGDTISFTASGTFTPVDTPAIYLAEYIVSISETDMQTFNDTFVNAFFITDSTYSRDANVLDGSVSLGTEAGGGLNIYGQNYDLPNGGVVTSVNAFFDAPVAGDSVSAVLYTVDASTGAPQVLVTSSQVHVFTAADAGAFVSFAFDVQVPFPANAEFFVGLIEYAPGNISLGVSNDIFTPESAWVKSDSVGGNVWFANDDFWEGEFSYILRPIMNYCNSLGGLASATADDGSGNGTAWVLASGGLPPYSYSWSNGGSTDTIVSLSSGTYTVTVTDAQGCVVSFNDILVDQTMSLEQDLDAGIDRFEVYPNPSNGMVSIEIDLARVADIQLEVYDLTGRMIQSQKISRIAGYRDQLDLSMQAPGVYLMHLKTNQGSSFRRVVIE